MRQLAIITLLIIPSLFAQNIAVPQLISSASLMINESGTVLVHGGEMKDLLLKIQVPISSEYQKVEVDQPFEIDLNGNPYVEISRQNPANPFHYSIGMRVHATQRKTESLPEQTVLSAQEMAFLSPTNRTQSSDAQMVALAKNITLGAQDDFEKVALIAIWVHNNVRYNEYYLGQQEDALAVLQHRQGVCFEYATLFAALARASGIPARYITGYVYSERFGAWLGHAWNEVYLGEWVPVDPTWFEVGTTDALHIESAKYLEMEQENNLVSNIYPASARLEWETNGHSGALAANIATLELEETAPGKDFRLEAASSRILPGDSTLVFLEIEGKDYQVVPVTLASCTGSGALEVEKETQYLVMRPGEKSVAVWKLKTPAEVPASYYYTCPLTLNSPYLESRVVEVKIDPRIKRLPEYSAQLQIESPLQGEQSAVLVTLPPERRNRAYYVITDRGVYQANLTAQTALIPFWAYGSGDKIAYVAGEGGGHYELNYTVNTPANASISIDGLTLPESLVAGKAAHASVEVSAKSYPADVKLELYIGQEILEQTGQMAGPTTFEFRFVPTLEGPLPVLAKLKTDGKTVSQRNSFANVIEQPEIRIIRSDVKRKGSALETVLFLEVRGQPEYAMVSLAGMQKQPQEDRVSFLLPEGEHTAKISWSDAAGNQYLREELVRVRENTFLGISIPDSKQPQTGGQGAGACPVALALLCFATIGIAFRR